MPRPGLGVVREGWGRQGWSVACGLHWGAWPGVPSRPWMRNGLQREAARCWGTRVHLGWGGTVSHLSDDGVGVQRPGGRSWTHSQAEGIGPGCGRASQSRGEGASRRETGLGKARRPEGTSTVVAWQRSGRPAEPLEEPQCTWGALGSCGRGLSRMGAWSFWDHQDPSESLG